MSNDGGMDKENVASINNGFFSAISQKGICREMDAAGDEHTKGAKPVSERISHFSLIADPRFI